MVELESVGKFVELTRNDPICVLAMMQIAGFTSPCIGLLACVCKTGSSTAKISSQNAPKLAILSSKIEKKKFCARA